MNLVDYAVIGVVALSVATAAIKGLVYELWMMAVTLGGLVLAAWNDRAWAVRLGSWGSEEARRFTAFVLVLGAVLLVGMMLGRMLRGMLRAAGLGWPDRVLGAGLGLVRGVVLAAGLLMMLAACPFNPRLIENSRLAPGLLRVSGMMAACMPAGFGQRFEQGLAAVERNHD